MLKTFASAAARRPPTAAVPGASSRPPGTTPSGTGSLSEVTNLAVADLDLDVDVVQVLGKGGKNVGVAMIRDLVHVFELCSVTTISSPTFQ